jgi:hypothetical protein
MPTTAHASRYQTCIKAIGSLIPAFIVCVAPHTTSSALKEEGVGVEAAMSDKKSIGKALKQVIQQLSSKSFAGVIVKRT